MQTCRKRLTLLACVALLAMSLTACGKSGTSSQDASSGAATTSSSIVSSQQQSLPASNSPASSAAASEVSKPPVQTTSSGSTAVLVGPSLGVPKSAAASYSYFDDAVFIGDSVSLKLQGYVAKQRQSDASFMGKAQFLVSGSLGSGNALWPVSDKSVHPLYNGQKMLIEDSVAKTGAKKVYIMLGINDVAVYDTDGAVKNMGTLIDRILAKSPGAAIYIQSATPMTRGGEKKDLNNKVLFEYDQKLYNFCASKGYNFVDVASGIRDSEGFLPDNYSSDNYVHFTDAACKVWIDYLLTHTV